MKIDQLSSEKRNRIENALIKEYAQRGYLNASTNAIVKDAGISKGSLFNYIGNKEAQYCYIVSYVLHFFKDKLHDYMTGVDVPKDYFENLLFKSNMKIKMSLEYPLEYKLMFDAYMEESPEIKAFMAEKYAFFSDLSMQNGRETLDSETLKDPNDRDKIVEVVHHLIAGYSTNYLNSRKKLSEDEIVEVLEKMTVELDTYFQLFRKHFFK